MGNGRPLLEINALHTAFHMQDNYDAVDDKLPSVWKNEILAIVESPAAGKVSQQRSLDSIIGEYADFGRDHLSEPESHRSEWDAL